MLVKNTTYFFCLILGFTFLGCKKAPNYPKEPTIQFDHLRIIHDKVNLVDSVSIYIKFQDGDGDIGNTPPNPNYLDFFLDIYKKTNGTFVRLTDFDNTQTYNGSLPLLSPYDVTGPIDGTIRNIIDPFAAPLPLGTPAPPFYPNDTLQFHVRIRDRAGNYSNWVVSTDYILWANF